MSVGLEQFLSSFTSIISVRVYVHMLLIIVRRWNAILYLLIFLANTIFLTLAQNSRKGSRAAAAA